MVLAFVPNLLVAVLILAAFSWLASVARALNQARVDTIDRGPNDTHAWPDELARLLANFATLYTKHVFASPNDQMHEDSPTTATSFAIIALAAARDRVRAGKGRVLVVKPVAPPPMPKTAEDLQEQQTVSSIHMPALSDHLDDPLPPEPTMPRKEAAAAANDCERAAALVGWFAAFFQHGHARVF